MRSENTVAQACFFAWQEENIIDAFSQLVFGALGK
jgi:hypothetical protein